MLENILRFIFAVILLFTGSISMPMSTTDQTYGIRADVALSQYESIAASEDPDLPAFTSTVYIDVNDNGTYYSGSGVLIDPQWILTAGHVVISEDEQALDGSDVIIYTDSDADTTGLQVKNVFINNEYLKDPYGADSSSYDIALLQLENPLTTIPTSPVYTGTQEELGATVWISGYGDYSSTNYQTYNGYSRLHCYENKLDRITSAGTDKGILATDFDSPDGTHNSLGDDNITTSERLLGPGDSSPVALPYEGTTVQGDSGGPMFGLIDTTWQVIGLTSEGHPQNIFDPSSDYGDMAFYCRVSRHSKWITSMMNYSQALA